MTARIVVTLPVEPGAERCGECPFRKSTPVPPRNVYFFHSCDLYREACDDGDKRVPACLRAEHEASKLDRVAEVVASWRRGECEGNDGFAAVDVILAEPGKP